jgi:HPt (histidine-containing phosphotransfer) domain-containing protein/DNA-binding NarL/FixJ family response regulator
MVADGSNPGFADRVLDMFDRNTRQMLDEIDTASRQGDLPTLQRAAHTLKSSSATVGALALSEQAQQLEMLLRAGREPAGDWPAVLRAAHDAVRRGAGAASRRRGEGRMSTTTDQGHLLLVDDDAMIRMLAAESLRMPVSTSAKRAMAMPAAPRRGAGVRPAPARRDDARHRRLRRSAGRSAAPARQWLPIMMLTGLNDTESIERAYAVGATDFVTKPINWALLSHRVRYALRTSRAIAEVTRSQASLAQAQRQARMGNWQWSLSDARFSVFGRTATYFWRPRTRRDGYPGTLPGPRAGHRQGGS